MFKRHWREYLTEAGLFGAFMASICLYKIFLYHPDSTLLRVVPSEFTRRILIGIATGATSAAIVYSPWGKRSGAHLNPALTLTFFRLGKIDPFDAVFYVAFQFAGGILGVALVSSFAGALLRHPQVSYNATVPGPVGAGVAFAAEILISCLLIILVLFFTNRPRLARYTGLVAGFAIAAFIGFESPISGASMNPARTFASAIFPGKWSVLWIYFLAPPLGMIFGAAIFRQFGRTTACAKLQHDSNYPCIFCEFQARRNTFQITKPTNTKKHIMKNMTKLKLSFTSLALALPLAISGCGHDSSQTDNMTSNAGMATNQSQMNNMTSNTMHNMGSSQMGHMGSNSMNMAGSAMNNMTSNHMDSPQMNPQTSANQSK